MTLSLMRLVLIYFISFLEEPARAHKAGSLSSIWYFGNSWWWTSWTVIWKRKHPCTGDMWAPVYWTRDLFWACDYTRCPLGSFLNLNSVVLGESVIMVLQQTSKDMSCMISSPDMLPGLLNAVQLHHLGPDGTVAFNPRMGGHLLHLDFGFRESQGGE